MYIYICISIAHRCGEEGNSYIYIYIYIYIYESELGLSNSLCVTTTELRGKKRKTTGDGNESEIKRAVKGLMCNGYRAE